MEQLNEFFTQYLDNYLFAIIILSGVFITKYTKSITSIQNVYKILIIATIVSVISFYITESDFGALPKYLFTYTLATSFYEVVGKYFTAKIKGYFNTKK